MYCVRIEEFWPVTYWVNVNLYNLILINWHNTNLTREYKLPTSSTFQSSLRRQRHSAIFLSKSKPNRPICTCSRSLFLHYNIEGQKYSLISQEKKKKKKNLIIKGVFIIMHSMTNIFHLYLVPVPISHLPRSVPHSR